MNDDATQKTRHALSYRAFWHLEAIGVLQAVRAADGSLSDYRSEVWEMLANAPESLVALIDTGVSGDHPYLAGRLRGQIDLTGLPMRAPKSASKDRPFEGMDAHFLRKLGLDGLQPNDFSWLERFCDGVSESVPFDYGAPRSANRLFSAHGTSCAGLVVASSDIRKNKAGNGSEGEDAPDSLAYVGVDPFSKLLSITTTFAPKPETLILAFLLAALKGAEVILVPRGISSEIMDDPEPGESSSEGGRRQAWRILRKVILTVSEHIPIICAAGNDAESHLIPPAALAAESASRNGIIAVGAISYEGVRSSYSSYGKGLTLVGPSDDGEMFNEDQARLDKTDRFFPDYPFEETARQTGVQEFTYAQPSVLAIDVPGPFGFQDSIAPSGPGDSVTQASGSFTAFGGTSAAASIVAGVAALVQRAAKEWHGAPLSGPDLRRLLVEKTIKEDEALPHGNGKIVPLPDIINARGSKQRLSFGEAFGAGVVNALAAVSAVRDGG
ncbi:MAG TPA: S8 family serine peptidase [Rhizobiaceae bacterium]|nr:S8 family serine peptidase [Rhizobiaceae bacterium]